MLLAFSLILPFFPSWLTAARLSYVAYNNSSDTFLYLDIARNILAGRGFLVSFNIYQYWDGLFYPALPFIHVGLPIAASVVYLLFRSLESVIVFGFILAFLNSFLIFFIVKRLYADKALAFWAALLFASTVSNEIALLRILTEPLSLFVTLMAVYLFVSRQGPVFRCAATIGILLGLGVFVRSASVLYPAVFFLAFLSGRGRGRLAAALPFILWPAGVLFLYEAFVYLQYGVFFPTYPEAFKNYYLATFVTGGEFFPSHPVVRPSVEIFFPVSCWAAFLDMGKVLWCTLRLLLIFAAASFFRIFRQRDRCELLLAGLAFFQTAAVLLFYSYARLGEFEWGRFLLLPLMSLIILAGRQLRLFCQRFVPLAKSFLFHAVFGIIFLSNLYQTGRTLEVYWQTAATSSQKVAELQAVAAWVREHMQETSLLAVSGDIIEKVWLERPEVILPFGNMLSEKKLGSFLKIYRPRAVIFEKSLLIEKWIEAADYGKADSWFSGASISVFVPKGETRATKPGIHIDKGSVAW